MEQAANIHHANSDQARAVATLDSAGVHGQVLPLCAHADYSSSLLGRSSGVSAAALAAIRMPRISELLIRGLDIVGALLIVILAMPVMILSALFIKINSSGLILYRPERPSFVERHGVLQGVRLPVKPGLTGFAQVRGFYDLKPAHKVEYDHLYIRNRSSLLNCYILLHTIPILFAKQGW